MAEGGEGFNEDMLKKQKQKLKLLKTGNIIKSYHWWKENADLFTSS